MSFQIEALGGLSAGIVGTVIGYPLDLIKTRMQTAASSSSQGVATVGTIIVRREGIQALYKGMTPPLISLSILNTINFTSYNYARSSIFHADRGWDVRNALSGLVGAPLASSISTVEHLVKTQLQVDTVHRYTGSWHCVTSLVNEGGVKILYTGHVINMAREGVFLGTYFYTYEGIRDWIEWKLPSQIAIPVAGGISGSWAWLVSFPLDCVKARIQGQTLLPPPHHEQTRLGAMNVFKTLIQTKGIRGLYSGVTPSVARAFLVSGSRFSAYEFVVWLFRKEKMDEKR